MTPEQRNASRAAIASKVASGEVDIELLLDEAQTTSLPELRRIAANRRQAERKVAALRLG